jgi:hypothetical protein
MKSFRTALLIAMLGSTALWLGCSSGSPNQPAAAEPATGGSQSAQKTEAPAKPSLFTARECFGRLQAMAMRWAPDAKPFLMESAVDPDSLGRDGKSPKWSAMFASPSRNATRTFTCSKTGIEAELETPYSSAVIPFDAFLFKTNSDEAFKVAQQHGGEGVLKRDDKLPVTYALQMSRGQSVPYWFVIYGSEMKNNKGVGVINATTGAFVRATK